MMQYSLYIKTHSVTGLKYLGMTRRDPFKYKGSGLHWQRHLTKHGKEHSTEVLGVYDNKTDLNNASVYYSALFNVVESAEWANIIPETGQPQDSLPQEPVTGWHHTDKAKSKISAAHAGKIVSKQTKKKISKGLKGRTFSEEHRAKLRAAKLGTKLSESHKANIVKAKTGMTYSPKSR